jgi:hypothetical protein
MASIQDTSKEPETGSGGYSEHPKDPLKVEEPAKKEGATVTGLKAILGRKKQIDDAISEAGG